MDQAAYEKKKQDWIAWLNDYGVEKFLDAFLTNVEGAYSTCIYCGQPIRVDILHGGGVPDWSLNDKHWQTNGGDFGCSQSPDTDADGTGGHLPLGVPIPRK